MNIAAWAIALALIYGTKRLEAQVPQASRLLSIEETGGAGSIAVPRSFGVCPDFDGDGVRDLLMPGGYVPNPKLPIVIFGLVEVRSAVSGRVIWEVRESPHGGWGHRFGYSIAYLDDLDGDKRPEILVGAPSKQHGLAQGAGSVYLISSKTKAVLREHKGTQANVGYGTRMASLGDLDGDGFKDYVIVNTRYGAFDFYSGRSGKRFRSFSLQGFSLGLPMTLPDLDKDGVNDLAFGAAKGCCSQGWVFLYSGKTFKLIRSLTGYAKGENFGTSLDVVPDVNNDGVDDLIVGARYAPGLTAASNGYARLISLKDGKLLQEWRSRSNTRDDFGHYVRHAGDLDEDGVADVVISQRIDKNPVHLQGFSGKTGRVIRQYLPIPGAGAPLWPQYLGDVNGDGVGDLAVPVDNAFPARDSLEIFSGRWVGLVADKTSLSLSRRESLGFRLIAGPAHRGKWYLILGSLSSDRPGLRLGAVYLPLLLDAYSLFTLGNVNSAILQRSFLPYTGTNSKATLSLVSGLPSSLVGRSFYHAFLIWDPSRGTIDFASNAVQTKISK